MTGRLQLALVAALVACGGRSPPVPAPSAAAPSESTPPNPTRYHMRRQYADLRLVERLLIAGKLDDGAVVATLLTRERDDRVARAAGELAHAGDLDQALRRVAVVASACAACHVRAGARVLFAPAPALPDDLMARHAWATDRLWEGVIASDVDRWRRGLGVLADSAIADGGTLRELARAQLVEATGAPDPGRRAIGYGKILITCASCHVQLGVKLP